MHMWSLLSLILLHKLWSSTKVCFVEGISRSVQFIDMPTSQAHLVSRLFPNVPTYLA
jgi:hypothetical protein